MNDGESIRIRYFPAEVLMPEYIKAMNEVGSVTIPVSGGSMVPFVAHMRDTVTLSAIKSPPKVGDIVLYIREKPTRKYVMHRIVRFNRKKCEYSMCGDAQTAVETGIRQEQLLAVATSVVRKGKRLNRGGFRWRMFSLIWRCVRPIRPVLLSFSGRLKHGG